MIWIQNLNGFEFYRCNGQYIENNEARQWIGVFVILKKLSIGIAEQFPHLESTIEYEYCRQQTELHLCER